MNKWLKRGLIVLAVLAVIGGGTYYWLILESGTPSTTYALDMKEIRRLADSVPGEHVVAIHDEHVSSFSFPGNAVLAGSGWDPVPMTIFSYKLVFTSGGSALIDTGLTPRGAALMGTKLDAAAAHPITTGLDRGSMPDMGGYVVSVAKPGAESILMSHLDDPVLAELHPEEKLSLILAGVAHAEGKEPALKT